MERETKREISLNNNREYIIKAKYEKKLSFI